MRISENQIDHSEPLLPLVTSRYQNICILILILTVDGGNENRENQPFERRQDLILILM